MITRRTFINGALVGATLPIAASAASAPAASPAFDLQDERILRSYSNFLFFERRFLNVHLFGRKPGWECMVPPAPAVDVFFCPQFLYPCDGPDWNGPWENPHERAARVLDSAGVDLELVMSRPLRP